MKHTSPHSSWIAIVAVLSGALIASTHALASKRTAKVGEPAPEFQLKDETGKSHTLSSYRGKILVLEWTNEQCPFVKRHCRDKTMNTLATQFSSKNVVWLAVNSSHFTTAESSKAHRKESGIPYPILQDPDGKTGKAYGARTTPHLFIVDTKGIIRYDGAIDDNPHEDKKPPQNYVANALTELIAGKNPTQAVTEVYGCSVKYKK